MFEVLEAGGFKEGAYRAGGLGTHPDGDDVGHDGEAVQFEKFAGQGAVGLAVKDCFQTIGIGF
ncbi:MAG: hypothetical protein M1609_00735 [Firmicutes bacterium]|nr:hypothetical protein [Bacillota bacterium]